MGVKPPTPGTIMSFNVVVRMHGDRTGFASLSPKVQNEADIHDASKWSDIVFTAPVFGASTLSREVGHERGGDRHSPFPAGVSVPGRGGYGHR